METYFNNLSKEEGSKEKLLLDLRTLIQDAERLCKSAAGNLTGKARDELESLTLKLKATGQKLGEQATGVARAAGHAVRENPYPTLGLAFGLGLLVGLLINRK